MLANLRSFNDYSGFLLFLILLTLFLTFRILSKVTTVLAYMYRDYRMVNRMDDREKWADEVRREGGLD